MDETRKLLDETLTNSTLNTAIRDTNKKVDDVQTTVDYIAGIVKQSVTKPPKVITNTSVQRPSKDFLGRDTEIESIDRAIKEGNNKLVLLNGIGGIGKSQICLDMFQGYRDTENTDIQHLGWISYDGNLKNSIYRKIVELKDLADVDQDAYFDASKVYLDKFGNKLLLIIDNANNPTIEEQQWISGLNCRVIITSRKLDFLDSFEPIEIGRLSKSDCIALYQKTLGKSDDCDVISQIIERADRHTITIVLLAKAQKAARISAKKLLESIDDSEFNLATITEKFGHDEYDAKFNEHLTKLFKIVGLSEEEIKLLKIFSLMPFLPLQQDIAKVWLELDSFEGINSLVNKGWLIDDGNENFLMHPVISSVTRTNYTITVDECWEEVINISNSAIASYYSEDGGTFLTAPFVFSVAKYFKDTFFYSIKLHRRAVLRKLFLQTADAYLYVHRDTEGAMAFARKALEVMESIVLNEETDEEDFEFSMIFNLIGLIYQSQADYTESIKWFEKALPISLKHQKRNLSLAAMVHSNIAQSYQHQGFFDKAFELFSEAKNLAEKNLNTDHSSLGKIYNNIGLLYYAQSEYDDAFTFFKMALDVNEKSGEEEHFEIATIYQNIGMIHEQKGEISEALNYYNVALGIKERILGKEKHIAAGLYHNIGIANSKLDNYEEAVRNLKLALSIEEKYYGKAHPETAVTSSSLAEIYTAMGDYEEALRIFESVERTFEGSEFKEKGHPRSARVHSRIADVYKLLKSHDKELERRMMALAASEKFSGTEHIDNAKYYIRIAITYNEIGEFDKVIEFYEKAVDLHEKNYGNSHLETAKILNNIALVCKHRKIHNKALEFFCKAAKILEGFDIKVYSDISLASIYNQVGLILAMKQEYGKALKFYLDSLKVSSAEASDDNATKRNFVQIYCNIASLYAREENHKDAIKYHLKALSLLEELPDDKPFTPFATSEQEYTEEDFEDEDDGEVGEYRPSQAAMERLFGIDVICISIANAYKGLGENKRALEYYFKAVQELERKLDKGEGISIILRAINNVYFYIIEIYQEFSDTDNVIDCLNKVIALWESHGDTENLNIGIASHLIAEIFKERRLFNEALAHCCRSIKVQWQANKYVGEKTLEICTELLSDYEAHGEETGRIDFYQNVSDSIEGVIGDNHFFAFPIYQKIALLHEGKNEYKMALPFRKKLLNFIFEYPDDSADPRTQFMFYVAYENIAKIFRELGNHDDAIEYFTRILEVCNANHSDNSLALRYTNIEIGNAHRRNADYKNAIEHYILSLAVRGFEDPSVSTSLKSIESLLQEIISLNSIELSLIFEVIESAIELHLHNGELASDVYELLADICKSIDNKDAESVYLNKAKYHKDNADNSDADDNFEKQLKWLFQSNNEITKNYDELPQELLEKSAHTAGLLFKGATAYRVQREYDKAVEWFLNVLSIQERIYESGHEDIIDTYKHIAFTFGDKGKFEDAIEWLNKVLSVQEKNADENLSSLAFTYYNIAIMYDHLIDPYKSLEFFQKTLNIVEANPESSQITFDIIFSGMSDMFLKLEQSDEALEYLQKAVRIRENALDRDERKIIEIYNKLALLFVRRGEHSQALEWNEKILILAKQILGAEDLNITNLYNNRAQIYIEMGEYNSALEWIQKALDIRKKILSDDDPDMATSYLALSTLYENMGNVDEALVWQLKVLDIYEKAFGDNNHFTATVRNNIAEMYSDKEDYNNAILFYKKALIYCESTLGFAHPNTATTYRHIANAYFDLGDLSSSQEWHQKVLDLMESNNEINPKSIGFTSKSITFANLAAVYHNQGDYATAIELCRQAIAIDEIERGKEHISSVPTYCNMAEAYRKFGDYENALDSVQKAISINDREYGAEHPDAVKMYSTMAAIYRNLNNFEKSMESQEKGLMICKNALGDEHPDTIDCYHDMSVFCNSWALRFSEQENLGMAFALCDKALEIDKSVFGEHPNTASTLCNIATFHAKKGDVEKAIELHQMALSIREITLGRDHPETALSYNNMAEVYHDAKEYEKAIELQARALKILVNKDFDSISAATVHSNMAFVYISQSNYMNALVCFQEALRECERTQATEQEMVKIYRNIAKCYYHIAEFHVENKKLTDALEWHAKAIHIYDNLQQENDYDAAGTYHAVADIYGALESYQEALKWYYKTLSLFVKLYGKDSMIIASVYSQIAGIYNEMSENELALEWVNKTLAKIEASSVVKHKNSMLVRILNEIGCVYKNQKDYDRALEMHTEALSIIDKFENADLLNSAVTSRYIAYIYDEQSNHSAALEWYQRVKVAFEAELGMEHIATADIYKAMAEAYDNVDEYSKALEFRLKATSAYEYKLGISHKSMSALYNNVAKNFERLEEYSEALTWYRKALDKCEENYGEKHPNYAAILDNMAGVYKEQEDYDTALIWYQRVLNIRETVLGEEHYDISITYHNMAGAYESMGKYEEALSLYHKSLIICERELGSGCYLTAKISLNIGVVYYQQDDFANAVPYFTKSFYALQEALGQYDSTAITAAKCVVSSYAAQDDYANVIKWLKKIVIIQEKEQGKEHIETAQTYNSIGKQYMRLSDFSNSMLWYKKALPIYLTELGAEHEDTISLHERLKEAEESDPASGSRNPME